jgi:hypothetical protein
MGGDLVVVQIGLDVIRDEDHHHIRRFGGVRRGEHFQPGGLRLGNTLAIGGEADDDINTGIAEIEGVSVALAAVANDGDCATGEVI